MNSKELLERADQRIAEVEDIKKARKSIEELDQLNTSLNNAITVIVLRQGHSEFQPNITLDSDECKELKSSLEAKLNDFMQRRIIRLEQLLGIRKPAIINSEFEAAIRGMEQSHKKQDPVEEKLSGILQEEAKKIEDKPVPLKPSEILEAHAAEIEHMYKIQMATVGSIAEKYGVKKTDVNYFLQKNKLFRSVRKEDGFLDAKVQARQNK